MSPSMMKKDGNLGAISPKMGSILKKRKRDEESKSPARKKRKAASKASMLLSSKGEMKCVDVTSTNINESIDTTGAKSLMNGTIPGNAIQNRLGRRIRMVSLRIMGAIFQVQNGAAPGDDFVHIYVVYDKQVNGTAYALADLLQSCDRSGTTATNTFASVNMSNSKRFKILRHTFMKIECPAGVSANQPAQESTDFHKVQTVDWYIPLKGLDTQYNTGTAGTIADIQTGALFVMVLGANSAANTQYSLQYNARLRFQDL